MLLEMLMETLKGKIFSGTIIFTLNSAGSLLMETTASQPIVQLQFEWETEDFERDWKIPRLFISLCEGQGMKQTSEWNSHI